MFDTAKQSDQTINPFLNSVAYGQSKVKNFKAGKSAVITVKLSRLERDDPTGGGAAICHPSCIHAGVQHQPW